MFDKFFDENWHSVSWNSMSTASYASSTHAKPSGNIVDDCRELIEAISDGNSVVYLGAGASKAAGLPDWRQFLEMLEREVEKNAPAAASSIASRINGGDFLVAAEMIQNELKNRLQDICHRTFGSASIPTPIHHAISAIPFSLAITTNYDCLLESAFPYSVPRLTWQNPHDILQNLRSRIFCVLKLHGDFAVRQSIVLTRSHYRNLMQFNDPLLNCLRMLLATKSFLFCGVSFSDPDLLALMDEAKSLYGSAFGPHFAIAPKRFYDATYASVLEDSYNIRTLIAPESCNVAAQADCVTEGVAELISHIGARAAYNGRGKQYSSRIPIHDDEPALSMRPPSEMMQVGWLLKDLVIRLGVAFGDVCLTNPFRPEHRLLYRVFSYWQNDKQPKTDYSFQQPLPYDALQSRMFLQRKIEEDFVSIPNIATAEDAIVDQGYYSVEYSPSNPSTRSSLLVPVYADGRRTGVITIEAESGFLFSRYHLRLIKHFAGLIGEMRTLALSTADSSLSLKLYGKQYNNFTSMLRRSRDLAEVEVCSLLYQLDPFNGTLYAPIEDDDLRKKHGDNWTYSLSEESLACEAYKQRRTVREPRSELLKDDTPSKMALLGKQAFNISGPIAAFPVHVRGVTAGVFVGWSGKAMHPRTGSIPPDHDINADNKQWRKNFWRAIERSRRMVHLLANEPSVDLYGYTSKRPARKFLEEIASKLKAIDGESTWGDRVRDARFRKRVIDVLLAVLVGENCGLQRARFFVFKLRHSELESIVCVGSKNRKGVQPPKAYSRFTTSYVGETIDADDFVYQTYVRAQCDPYARLQDADSVGGQDDPSQDRLHKVAGCPWIVAPVGPQRFDAETGVRRDMMAFGYIAADNFAWDSKRKQMAYKGLFDGDRLESNSQFIYQRFCIDFVSDILAPLARCEWEQHQPKSC